MKFFLNAKASGRESGKGKEKYPDRDHHRPERTQWMIRFAEPGAKGIHALAWEMDYHVHGSTLVISFLQQGQILRRSMSMSPFWQGTFSHLSGEQGFPRLMRTRPTFRGMVQTRKRP
jgi:hypothetical protein